MSESTVSDVVGKLLFAMLVVKLLCTEISEDVPRRALEYRGTLDETRVDALQDTVARKDLDKESLLTTRKYNADCMHENGECECISFA